MKNYIIRTVKMALLYSFLGLLLQGILVNLIFAITPSEGQNLREVKVSVNAVNITLEQALQIIESKTNFKFTFFEEGLPLKEKATVIVDDESLYNILEVFAKDYGLTFNRINDQIVVKKSYGQKENLVTVAETGSIKGKVIDAKTGEGIISASVVIKGTKRGAATDMSGNYAIENLEAGKYTLVVSSIGFKSKEATVNVISNQTAVLNFQLEQTDINMNEVVVTTSTVIQTPVKKLPNTITVVTARDLERMNPTNIAEMVRLTVPGAIYTDEGAGTVPGTFSVRGVSQIQGSSTNLKVYVDGVEVSDPIYIAYMDPSVIERVEVVPGPQASTIYGSRAISGVMQIFTKSGVSGDAKLSGKVGLKTIDNRYVPNSTPIGQEFLLNVNGGFNGINYYLGVNYNNEPQWVDLFEEQTLNLSGSSKFSIGNLSGGLSINYSKFDNTTAWNPLNYNRDKKLGRTLTAPTRLYRTSFGNYALNLNYKAAENWIHNLIIGYNALESFNYERTPSTTTKLYNVIDRITERWSVSYNTSYQANLSEMFGSSITFGTDWTQYAAPYFNGNVADRMNYEFVNQNPALTKDLGIFGQTQLSYNDFIFLTAGLRADKRPAGASEGFTWSPRLGLSSVYELKEWIVKGRIAWGQSVIIPDASQFAGSESPSSVILPNPNLLSQVQRGYEVGADLYYTDILSLGITYFNQTPLDLIEPVSRGADGTGRPLWQFQNVSEVRNEGFEIRGIVRPYNWLSINVNFGKTKSTVVVLGPNYRGNLKVDDEITGKPNYTFSTNIEITPIEGTTVTLSAFQFGSWIAPDYDGYLYDVFSGNYKPAVKRYPDGYQMTYPTLTRINIGIFQKITNQFNGFLRINNITNTDKYERINSFVAQPRTIILGIQFSRLTF